MHYFLINLVDQQSRQLLMLKHWSLRDHASSFINHLWKCYTSRTLIFTKVNDFLVKKFYENARVMGGIFHARRRQM